MRNRGREGERIHYRHILQMNGQSVAVGADLYGAIRNFDDPEKTAWQSPRAEVMNLLKESERPRTEVVCPEVDSYLDKRAVRKC